ncbi:hypothetical protein HMPREF1556_00253 [Porphyromonas sp. oral taxon 278 str. W7784]|nr:hypothetical protein HMPREF1556_00253 [Porphyromonas sp. oral taxon 278 str. W7784]
MVLMALSKRVNMSGRMLLYGWNICDLASLSEKSDANCLFV